MWQVRNQSFMGDSYSSLFLHEHRATSSSGFYKPPYIQPLSRIIIVTRHEMKLLYLDVVTSVRASSLISGN